MASNPFFSLNGEEQTALAALLAVLIAKELNLDQMNVLGNFLQGVGQNILIIQAVASSQSQSHPPEYPDSLVCLVKEIETLKVRVSQLEKQSQA